MSADASDPDGDALTYRWSAPAGAFQNPADRQTVWTAPLLQDSVEATVSVDDGKGGTASASITLRVLSPPPVIELNFEDLLLDLDRSTLQAEAATPADDAVSQLRATAWPPVVINGASGNAATAESNLALGEAPRRRGRETLTWHGVDSSRLDARSDGEERPIGRQRARETGRQSRGAAVVVKVQ